MSDKCTKTFVDPTFLKVSINLQPVWKRTDSRDVLYFQIHYSKPRYLCFLIRNTCLRTTVKKVVQTHYSCKYIFMFVWWSSPYFIMMSFLFNHVRVYGIPRPQFEMLSCRVSLVGRYFVQTNLYLLNGCVNLNHKELCQTKHETIIIKQVS